MLSKTTTYAIRSIVFLAEKSEPALIRDISEATNIPYPYLAKIVNTLTRKGFLKSQRGFGGGITIGKDPKSISLYDICEVFDDPVVQEKKCILGIPTCDDDTLCPICSWYREKERIRKLLKRSTVAKIASAINKEH